MIRFLPIFLLCVLLTDIKIDDYRAALIAGKIDYQEYIELRNERLAILDSIKQ